MDGLGRPEPGGLSKLESDGFMLLEGDAISTAADELVQLAKTTPTAFNPDTFDLWAKHFGYGNDVIKEHLARLDGPVHLVTCNVFGPNSEGGMRALYIANTPNIPVAKFAKLMVMVFEKGARISIETGSHLKLSKPDENQKFKKSRQGHVIEKPTIKIHPDCFKLDMVTELDMADGGSVLADARIQHLLKFKSAVVLVYMVDPDRKPMILSTALRAPVENFSRVHDNLKIHAHFSDENSELE